MKKVVLIRHIEIFIILERKDLEMLRNNTFEATETSITFELSKGPEGTK